MAANKNKSTFKKLTDYGKSLMKLDSWASTLTGLGNIASDKRLGYQPVGVTLLDDDTLEALYTNDGLAKKIVGRLPEDAYRQGFTVTGTEKGEELLEQYRLLEGSDALKRAATFGRLFGWGAVLIISDDPGFPSEPIDPSKIKNLRLEVCDRRDLEPVDNQLRAKAEFFKIQSSYSKAEEVDYNEIIHFSRLIQFGGEPTSVRIARSNKGSDLSVLHACYDALRDYDSNSSSAALMMSDGSMKVMKITDFVNILSGNEISSFKTRMELMDLSMFVGKTLPIDKEEDFQFVERSFSGVGDVITESKVRLAACAGMPITVLFGVSPAGLNATGESDTRHWYDQVKSAQTNLYTFNTEYLIKIIALYLGMNEPKLGIEWESLWQKTPEEDAAWKKAVAEVDAMYISMGCLTPEEVRIARFSDGTFNDKNPELIEQEIEPAEPVELNPEEEEREEEEEDIEEGEEDIEEGKEG